MSEQGDIYKIGSLLTNFQDEIKSMKEQVEALRNMPKR